MRNPALAFAKPSSRICETQLSHYKNQCFSSVSPQLQDTSKVVSDAKKVMLGKIKAAFTDIDGSVWKMRVADAVEKARNAEEQNRIAEAVAAAKAAAVPRGLLGRFMV